MRQLMSHKNVARLRLEHNLPIVAVMVRGGTNHRKDLCLDDGTMVCLWPDGDLEKSEHKHGVDKTKWFSPNIKETE